MAVTFKSNASLLSKLEEQLTCAVCLDIYADPKTLPCHHSFCQQCLEGLLLDSKSQIACPTCRQRTMISKSAGIAKSFPAAFHLNNLKEIHTLSRKVSDHKQLTCDSCTEVNDIGYCKECDKFFCQQCINIHTASHETTSLRVINNFATQLPLPRKVETCSCHKEPVTIFCETCNEVICCECAQKFHCYHEWDTIDDNYQMSFAKLESCLDPVRRNLDAMKIVLSNLTRKEEDVKEQGEVIKAEIHAMVEEMISILRQSESELTASVQTITQDKLQVLSEQKRSAKITFDQLEGSNYFVEQSLKVGSPQQIVMCTKQMMERMTQVIQIDVEEFNSSEEPDLKFIPDSNAIEALNHIGDIVSASKLEGCKVRRVVQYRHVPEEQTMSFPLSIRLPDSSFLAIPSSSLTCNMTPPNDKWESIVATVSAATSQPGVYNVCCSPVIPGYNEVTIEINGVQLKSISIGIPSSLHFTSTPDPVQVITGFHRPHGVALHDSGHIIVTDYYNHRVRILDREVMNIESFGEQDCNTKFTYPRGVAVTLDSFILVTDDHKIQKMNMNGQCIASVGEWGSGRLQFDTPDGIAVSPVTGHIYVADRHNHRIQVLTPDLTFYHSFGNSGSAEGQLNEPSDIATDNQGLLYVADQNNHRIQKFTSEGKFLTQFNSKRFNEQLGSPAGIAFSDINKLLYVTERDNHCVSIFSTDGQFIYCFGEHGAGENCFDNPEKLQFDKKGLLYISDYLNRRLVVY